MKIAITDFGFLKSIHCYQNEDPITLCNSGTIYSDSHPFLYGNPLYEVNCTKCRQILKTYDTVHYYYDDTNLCDNTFSDYKLKNILFELPIFCNNPENVSSVSTCKECIKIASKYVIMR